MHRGLVEVPAWAAMAGTTNDQNPGGNGVASSYLPGSTAGEFERFRRKTRTFLAEHHGDAAIDKSATTSSSAPADVASLRQVLVDGGVR